MTRYTLQILMFVLFLLWAAPFSGQAQEQAIPPAASGDQRVMPAEQAFQNILSYEHGQNRKAAVALEELVNEARGYPGRSQKLSQRMIELLDNPKATLACKEFACKQLMKIGNAESVPALAKLIGDDENLAFLGRYALERIPDPAAAAALRDALTRTKGRVLTGVIVSLGNRRDREAVPLLMPLLTNPDAEIAAAAARSLGWIGDPEALKALSAASPQAPPPVRTAIFDAQLAIADHFLAENKKEEATAIYEPLMADDQPVAVRVAALRGFAATKPEKAVPRITALLAGPDPQMFHAALQLVRTTTGEQAAETFTAQLAKLPDEKKPLLIEALADRGAPQSRPAILQACQSNDPAVRLAALKALATFNAEADAPLLIDIATREKNPELRGAAFQTLIALRGPAVDAAVLDRLADAKGETRIVLLRALTLRRAPAALGELLKAAGGNDPALKAEALALLRRIASDKDLPSLLKVLLAAKPGKSRAAAEQALYASCLAIPDSEKRLDPLLAVWKGGDPATRAAILPVLGRLGGAKALEVIHAALKDPDESLQDAGVRGIANWPDAMVAGELMQIAKTSAKPAHRAAALRAFARVVAKPSDRPPQETFAMLKEALELTASPEDKRYVLTRFTGARTPEALELVVSYLDDPKVQAGAAQAAVGLADRLKQTHREQARQALKKVLLMTSDQALHAKADELLRRIQ